MLVSGLLMAGTDTTRNQLAAAIYTLCDHPDQWQLLAENPSSRQRGRRGPAALPDRRRDLPRTAVDVELAGVTIPAGTLVVVNSAAPTAIPPSTTIPIGSTSPASPRRRC